MQDPYASGQCLSPKMSSKMEELSGGRRVTSVSAKHLSAPLAGRVTSCPSSLGRLRARK